MSIETQVDTNSPLYQAWLAYKATDDFANTRKWARASQHTEGSMWAAFVEGFRAAAPAPAGAPANEEWFVSGASWAESMFNQQPRSDGFLQHARAEFRRRVPYYPAVPEGVDWLAAKVWEALQRPDANVIADHMEWEEGEESHDQAENRWRWKIAYQMAEHIVKSGAHPAARASRYQGSPPPAPDVGYFVLDGDGVAVHAKPHITIAAAEAEAAEERARRPHAPEPIILRCLIDAEREPTPATRRAPSEENR